MDRTGPPTTAAADAAWADLLSLGTIVAMTLIISFPALQGQFLDYMDNAVHLAELRDLGRPDSNGWSELGFCGFPLHTLQSPLLYGLLARFSHNGAWLNALYTTATVA